MIFNAPILIIGGGIGGMSLAAALHKLDIEAHVYERSPEIKEVGAGLGLWNNGLFALDQIGAGDRLRKGCLPLRRGEFANDRGQVLSSFDIATFLREDPEAACYIVHRAELLAAILEKVPPHRVHTGRRCVEVRQTESGAQAIFDDGEKAEGALLVGADGIHSVARKAVVGYDLLRYSGQTCFRGIAHVALSETGVIREIQGAGKRGAICPMTADTVYWWTALNAPEGALIPQGERRDFLLHQYRGWPWDFDALIARTPTEEILQNDLYDRAPASRCYRGRIALLGDAAHPTTPNLGQGANMAIDDAIVLARALRRAGELGAALREYESTRQPRTTMIVQRSWQFGRLARWDNPALLRLREWMARLTPRAVYEAEIRRQILENVGPLDA